MARFNMSEAQRGQLPLFIGLCGPSGGGKTFSALRLATGIQRVAGGKVAVIDTESKRALHYAESFAFHHIPFDAPFGPLDYREAIAFAIEQGAHTVVIDSMSHEHEGVGGVLEQHEAEVERLVRAWKGATESSVTFPAWAKPKAARRALLNYILQVNVNLICCFRAKQKLQLPTKQQKADGQRDPIALGWMPIAGPEYAYEMTALGVLPPGAKGVPNWKPPEPGSEMVTKRPQQFEAILQQGKSLSEDMGEQMALWAAGKAKPQERKSEPARNAPEACALLDKYLAAIDEAADSEALEALYETIAADLKSGKLPKDSRARLRAAYDTREESFDEQP